MKKLSKIGNACTVECAELVIRKLMSDLRYSQETVILYSPDERRELVRAVWYISRRETLRECANLGRAPRIEEFFELEGL